MIPRNGRRLVAAAGAFSLFLPTWALASGKTTDRDVCITAAEQGQSQRDDGQYRLARESFLKCAMAVCPRVIVQSCTKWLRELDEGAPTIVLSAKDSQGNDLTDAIVTFDGAPFLGHLDGKPVEVDVGEHVVRFQRAGARSAERKLLLRAGEKARLVSVTLAPLEGDVAAPPPISHRDGPVPAPTPAREPILSARHVVAASVGGLALGAAATGLAFVVQANHNQTSAANLRASLGASGCAQDASISCRILNDDVHTEHNDVIVATGLFVGAGVFAAAAIAAWVFWPAPDAARIMAKGWLVPTHGGATLQLAGTFQ